MEAPSGTIILWTGTSAPSGWTVWTSANTRFVMGVPSGGSYGATGGASTHAHTASAAASGGAHTHVAQSFVYGYSSSNNVSDKDGLAEYGASDSHAHNCSFTLGSAGAHTHTVASANTGAANNTPPYKTAYYIIKS